MDDKYYYSTNLQKKIDSQIQLTSRYNLCYWCDLLGFGKILFENQWNLSMVEKEKIYKRLRTAHTVFLNNISPIIETSLILNDGLVKVSEIKGSDHLDFVGFFIRGCIYTHNGIKSNEISSNLPGPRSILTFGESIEYLVPEIKADDYVLNYTKRDPDGLSSFAKETGNPISVYNPVPFQMNMGFSKAYTLDSLGSKYGIEGSNFYIDQSVIELSKNVASERNISVNSYTVGNDQLLLLEKGDDHVYFGFKYDKGIAVEYKGWKTMVYRLKSFYPPDEKITEFELEIE